MEALKIVSIFVASFSIQTTSLAGFRGFPVRFSSVNERIVSAIYADFFTFIRNSLVVAFRDSSIEAWALLARVVIVFVLRVDESIFACRRSFIIATDEPFCAFGTFTYFSILQSDSNVLLVKEGAINAVLWFGSFARVLRILACSALSIVSFLLLVKEIILLAC